MRRPTFIAICIALASALGPGVRAARAQTADDLFDPGSMQEIRFFINSKDLALLRENWQDNTKYPADMTWRNIRVRNVSVRARGSGSRNPQKPGLQVSFDHYTDGQHFLGLSTLVLKNEWQDASFLRERIAMAFYNRMGFAAPREGWARVYVNNEVLGPVRRRRRHQRRLSRARVRRNAPDRIAHRERRPQSRLCLRISMA